MIERPFSLYIHVPFCSKKCPYCDFNTYATPALPELEYVDALCRELSSYRADARFITRPIRSIFFGGGTPSLLSPEAIGRIISYAGELFALGSDAEVTLEANPSQPERARYEGYRSNGVNRISFGVQSFDAARLKLLGRDHSAEDASNAVGMAVAAGISNVSIDIIFGVPEQSIDQLRYDLACAVALPITHLSTYALTIEQGTPFFQRERRGLLHMPPEDDVVEMLRIIPHDLAAAGFKRYEISNYTKHSYESVHNSAYWVGQDYLGIGAGAHSYVATYNGEQRVSADRWSTFALPAEYMKRVAAGSALSWRETLDSKALSFEFFYLGLRRSEGVSKLAFERYFGEPYAVRYGELIEQLQEGGFIQEEGDAIKLTEKGIALSDSIFERFV